MNRNLWWAVSAVVVAVGGAPAAEPAAAQTAPCPIASLAPPSPAGSTQTVVVGQPSPCPPAGGGTQADYEATIDFGDGTTGPATFDEIWLLRADHLYLRGGTYQLVATVRHRGTGETFTLARRIEIPPAPRVRTATRWNVDRGGPGSPVTARPSRRATHIRVRYGVPVCGNPRLAGTTVKRQARRIVVTVRIAVDQIDAPCPAIEAYRTVRIDLKGRLGKRSVFDGGTNPATRRIEAPTVGGLR